MVMSKKRHSRRFFCDLCRYLASSVSSASFRAKSDSANCRPKQRTLLRKKKMMIKKRRGEN